MAASKFRPPPQRLLHAEPTELARPARAAIGDVSDDGQSANETDLPAAKRIAVSLERRALGTEPQLRLAL
ncbi:hypothetical protein [Rhizobium mongolense]|uniref:Uncharacterized protein n=1 Tax=Rhizobium mongolense TaxID=57676 RepID=A0ABR6IFA4_9HYPH|nr:hypothetical protein [Rhizobium mongolense]MBB4226552.1 hypothetical protein [Rhizobium mongolense]